MGSDGPQKSNVEQTLALLDGMQRMRLVPTDAKVTDAGVELTGITKWEDPIDSLRDGAR